MNATLRLIIILLLLAGLFGPTDRAAAQEEGLVHLTTPQIDLFPRIRFYMSAYTGDGRFVTNLLPKDVQVIENGQAVKVDEIKKIENGLQVILAVNTGPHLATTRSGVTEYQRIQTALEAWARALPQDSIDDFSLTTPTGLFLIRSQDTSELAQAIVDYQPDLKTAQPPLNSLAEALDMATDPLEQPLMKRAILYITPPLPDANTASIPDLAARAQEIGVRVNVWLMKPASGASQASQDALQMLAAMTGGKFFQVTPEDALPEIEPLFEPLRQTYQVSYTSAIQESGPQTLSVQVNRAPYKLASEQTTFDLTVQPPNPIFLSPPAAVDRTWTLAQKDVEPVLTPDAVPLQILVEFPDQHERPLVASRLYVNGDLAVENLAEPFDSFTWAMEDITVTGRYMLRVEAVDTLGLTGTSMEIPIDVTVAQPAQTSLAQQISGRGMIAVGAVAVSGMALGLVLFLTNTQRRLHWKRQLADRKRMKDPVTQPVVVAPVRGKKERTQPKKERESTPRPSWPLLSWRSSPDDPTARLICLDESEQPVTGGIIPLTRQEITFGSDPRRATQVLNSPTVDGLHARLYRSDDDTYYLADQSSIAGSWINYAPVNASGARLEHGDLIHIGKVMFRFELGDPARVHPNEVKVTVLD